MITFSDFDGFLCSSISEDTLCMCWHARCTVRHHAVCSVVHSITCNVRSSKPSVLNAIIESVGEATGSLGMSSMKQRTQAFMFFKSREYNVYNVLYTESLLSL
jgi:hypothetical protein